MAIGTYVPHAASRLLGTCLVHRLGIAMMCVAASTTSAFAESARAHVSRGEALARDGRLTDAIDAFKAADRIEPRASHACLIALAYMRRELWTQAELFLARCRERATAADPLPVWVPLAEEQLRERTANTRLATVDVTVQPADLAAQISVSSFAPDEQFPPRTIRLPLGRHVVTATAPGRAPVHALVDVKDTSGRRVVLRFSDARFGGARERERIPTLVMGAGATAIVAGLGYHLTALRASHAALARARDDDRDHGRGKNEVERLAATYERRRTLTYGLYGAGAAAVLTGVVLRHTVYRDAPESAPRVTASIGNGAAAFAVEWQR